MKRLIGLVLALAALAALEGCAVVPYNAAYPAAYPVDPYGTVYAQPAYAPVYVGPPVYFGFGLNYRSGGYHPHRFGGGY